MSCTGNDFVPTVTNFPVPVIPAVRTDGIPRYVPYRTHLDLHAVKTQKAPYAVSTEETKSENENRVSLNSKFDQKKCISCRLRCESDSEIRILVRSQSQISFVQIETYFFTPYYWRTRLCSGRFLRNDRSMPSFYLRTRWAESSDSQIRFYPVRFSNNWSACIHSLQVTMKTNL